MDRTTGGNIIDDAVYNLTNVTNSIMTEVIQKLEEDNARANNTAALKKATKENGLVKEKRNQRLAWEH